MNYALKLSKKLSFGEEIANTITHTVGAVLMLMLAHIALGVTALGNLSGRPAITRAGARA